MDNDAFLDLWSLDELPACEAGMKLLKGVFDSEEQPVFWNTLRLYAEVSLVLRSCAILLRGKHIRNTMAPVSHAMKSSRGARPLVAKRGALANQ
jgi:hypothetical protein